MIYFPIQSVHHHIHSKPIPPDLSLSQVAQTTWLVEDDGAQSTGVFHGQLQDWIGLFFARVVTDNTAAECGMLIRIKMVTSQLTTSYPTDSMDEIPMIEIFEPILVWVVGIGSTIEVMGRGILDTILIASILQVS